MGCISLPRNVRDYAVHLNGEDTQRGIPQGSLY